MAGEGPDCGRARTARRRPSYRGSMTPNMDHADGSDIGLGPEPEHVGTLLVILPPGLAGIVDAVPALRHVRMTYPYAVISAVACGEAGKLLDACPYVDRRIDARRPAELVLEQFDLAVSLADAYPAATPPHVFDRTYDLSRVDASVRAAYRDPGSPVIYDVHPVRPVQMSRSAAMQRLVWLLGGSVPSPQSSLWATLADRHAAARILDGAPSEVVVMHPFSTHPSSRWSWEGWRAVTTALTDEGACVVLVGLDRDEDAELMAAQLGAVGAINLIGITDVGALVGVLERAMVFVGVDSGPAALARALGMHAVIVGAQSEAYVRQHESNIDYVQHDPCLICDSSSCMHIDAAGHDLPIERVIAQVQVRYGRAARSIALPQQS